MAADPRTPGPSGAATSAAVMLRPGAPVLRRDASTLQVGLDAPHRALLADSPGVRRLLGDLREGRARGGAERPADEAEGWRRLHAADLLVLAAAPRLRDGHRAPEPGTTAAVRAWAGPDAQRRLTARSRLRVAFDGPDASTSALRRLLEGSGLGLVEDTAARDLVVVSAAGEIRRERTDPLVREGMPHLLISSRGGLPRIGPLVVPGATACLRCVDAHEAESDPRRPLLVEQAAVEPDPPRDPVLAALALAWAARDLLRYAEGEVPTSWSATVCVLAGGLPQVQAWPRHLHCGCTWDVDVASAG